MSDSTPSDSSTSDAGRLEAFSDGVMAIAITLLVLDLAVPGPDALQGRSLASALGHEWPSYLAYVVSFLIIGIIWVNHHAMFRLVRSVDRWVLFANLMLLLVVSAIPFPTRLLADYLRVGGNDARVAAAVYSGTMVLMSFAYLGLWIAVSRKPDQLHHQLDAAARRASLIRFGGGGLVYLATLGLAFVSAVVTLVVHGVIALYYCFDQLGDRSGDAASPAGDGG